MVNPPTQGGAFRRSFAFLEVSPARLAPGQFYRIGAHNTESVRIPEGRSVYPVPRGRGVTHSLVQDTAHSSLLRGTRRQLHAQIAEALETDSPKVMGAAWLPLRVPPGSR